VNPEPSNNPFNIPRLPAATTPSNLPAELRAQFNTPLTYVLECSDKLLAEGSRSDSEEWQFHVQKIKATAEHLLMLVNSNTDRPAPRPSFLGSAFAAKPFVGTTLPPQKTGPGSKGDLLIVDDHIPSRDLLTLLLLQEGFSVTVAENGEQALWTLHSKKFDLVLLDIVMPKMDGYEVLQLITKESNLLPIPVIMISGVDQIESVVRCIELGAEDFIPKPFNPVLLRAKIGACLEKKRLRDQDQANLVRLRAEQERSESLLLNILPKVIADRLKTGESTIVDAFPEVTVLFADLADFTTFSARLSPFEVVKLLNEIFSEFDRLADAHQLEKIKTIGDAYLAVGGLPTPRPDHAHSVVEMALDMQATIRRLNSRIGSNLQLRIGISTGPVSAGIIGTKKFTYDLWGDTVNLASRMESHGEPGSIQVDEQTYQRLRDRFQCVKRGTVEIKGKGLMTTYLVRSKLGADSLAT
jgi:adenylate cyclase